MLNAAFQLPKYLNLTMYVYAVELSFLTILTLYDRAQDKYRPFFQSPFQDSNLSVEDWKQAAGKKVVLHPYVN